MVSIGLGVVVEISLLNFCTNMYEIIIFSLCVHIVDSSDVI